MHVTEKMSSGRKKKFKYHTTDIVLHLPRRIVGKKKKISVSDVE